MDDLYSLIQIFMEYYSMRLNHIIFLKRIHQNTFAGCLVLPKLANLTTRWFYLAVQRNKYVSPTLVACGI